MSLVAGLGGAARNACVALSDSGRLVGICEQERITRVRSAVFNPTGLPDEALDTLLRSAGRQRPEITAYAVGEDVQNPAGISLTRIEHHFAHACAAFLPSPFPSATIVVCDEDAPYLSVWEGNGAEVRRIEWPWTGKGFAHAYSRGAEVIGFVGSGREQRMEALARLKPAGGDDRVQELIRLEVDRLHLQDDWEARIAAMAGAGEQDRISVAAGLQARLGGLLIELLGEVSRRTAATRPLCLGGSLFFNSYFCSRAKCSGLFEDVFVPINPGNPGLAVAGALHVSGARRQTLTPFLGPSYSAEDIKATLDNCKLQYRWASESEAVAMAVEELQKGRLVAWFEGAMEWGPRALGGRSILANPLSQYVLDNLNRFLKHRERWRGYGLSGLEAAVAKNFEGPDRSPYMEGDYTPHDIEQFRHILPGPDAAVRVQTVGSEAPSGFRALLQAFGEHTGVPILVNTSFNGFQEPIVCSPRDAVRVFFGTGIDTLVLENFVIRK
jgi:carbamoyltransferase